MKRTIQTEICTCDESKSECRQHGPKRQRLLSGSAPGGKPFKKRPSSASFRQVSTQTEPKREFFRIRKDKPKAVSWLDWIQVESTLLYNHIMPEIEEIIGSYLDPELSGSEEHSDDIEDTQLDSSHSNSSGENPDDDEPTAHQPEDILGDFE